MGEYIVDFQAYKQSRKEFVIKELAILKLGKKPSQYIFKPPCDWYNLPAKQRNENTWIKHNLLGIEWNNGGIPYEKIENILRPNLSHAKVIYVKGEQKVKWLEKFVKNVNDISFKCPTLRTMKNWKIHNNPCKYYQQTNLLCCS